MKFEIDCIREATFSLDKVYRYLLLRTRGDIMSRYSSPEDAEEKGKVINFIMLNPSKADEIRDDPTVAKCMRWAWEWGYDQLIVTNIFALRSTDPEELYNIYRDPVGEENDAMIALAASQAQMVICAWGNHGDYQERGDNVKKLVAPVATLYHLGLNKTGQPKHPLYLKNSTLPKEWL